MIVFLLIFLMFFAGSVVVYSLSLLFEAVIRLGDWIGK